MSRRFGFAATLVVAIPVGLSACGSDDGGGTQGGGDPRRTVATAEHRKKAPRGTINLGDYYIEPMQLTVRRGTTLQVDIVDADFHNLTLERGPDPKKDTQDVLASPTRTPGESERLKVDLKPGTYAMTCTVPEHRERGMVGTITVR